MSWAYEGYTTLKLVWIAASKAFSNSSNDVNTLGQSNLTVFHFMNQQNRHSTAS